jgi:hypothetical protein
MSHTLTPEAVHEAAHAVIATIVGVPVIRVGVHPTPICKVARPNDDSDLDAYIVQGLAPEVAEAEILGLYQPDVHAEDRHNANRLLKHMRERDGVAPSLQVYRKAAHALVKQHANVIVSVAHALLKHGSVRGEGIAAVCRVAGIKPAKLTRKYRADQERETDGRFADEGKGSADGGTTTSKPKGMSTAARAALIGGGLLAASVVLGPGARAAARGIHRYRAATRRAQNAGFRAVRSESARRAAMNAMAAHEARSLLRRGTANVRNVFGSTTRRALDAAGRTDARLERGIDRATSRLPPRAREAVRQELRHGSAGPDPAGKLIEIPSWMWPF